MLLRTIADKQGELVFSDHFPAAVQPYLLPGAVCFATSGPFGHLLYQSIHTPNFTLWHRSYLLHRYATFTCIHAQPALKLVFQLQNSLTYTSAALGPLEMHEHAYNLCFVPSVHNKMLFRKEGLYSCLEIHLTEVQLQQLVERFSLLASFLENIRQQQGCMLMRVHQVATPAMMYIIRRLLLNTDRVIVQERCAELLAMSLQQMTEHPRTKNAHLPPKEVEALYQARGLLLQHLHLPGLPANLSELVQLTDYKLKNGFQQIYESTPAEYLHHVRMEKALELLNENHINIYDVADQTGYTNVNSFINAFKKYYHYSPLTLGKPSK